MTELVEVTTTSGRLRHLARPEAMQQARYGAGRTGQSLCAASIFTDAYDQAAFDEYRSRWSTAYKQVPISSLPTCKRCIKKAGAA